MNFQKVEFLISANMGEEPKPIAKIASGGELSRIMLALKNVIAEKDHIHTLIFDEIDTGDWTKIQGVDFRYGTKKIEVVAAVILKAGEYFATQRGYGEFEGMWTFSGGNIDAGEKLKDVLKR